MNTTNFKPNDRVLQIFMRSDGFPIVIKYDVISSDDDSLVLAPIGEAGDMTGKVITFTKEQGIPRTYLDGDINRMFTDYLANTQGWNQAKLMMATPKDLLREIQFLKKIFDLWNATLSANTAPSPDHPIQEELFK